MKAVSDFRLAPDLTQCCFVLPKWKLSPWYKTISDYFEIVEEYPKGSTKVFSTPKGPHFTPYQTETTAGGRILFGALPWDVIAIYKEKFTITGIYSAMRAHLRFGHISLDEMHCIQ
jgi:hypothetical protein